MRRQRRSYTRLEKSWCLSLALTPTTLRERISTRVSTFVVETAWVHRGTITTRTFLLKSTPAQATPHGIDYSVLQGTQGHRPYTWLPTTPTWLRNFNLSLSRAREYFLWQRARTRTFQRLRAPRLTSRTSFLRCLKRIGCGSRRV